MRKYEGTEVPIPSRTFEKKYDFYFNLYHGQILTFISFEICYISIYIFFSLKAQTAFRMRAYLTEY